MANEITVPLLPCRSIDEIVEFYTMLGFTRTYYQVRPNPYVSLEREDIQLDFFGMPDFDPADSYGSCLVIVPDTGELFAAFAAGMREVHGKLLVSGIPRMTRPRKRKNAANHSGFTVVDPGGNWIRIMAARPAPEEVAAGRLTTTLHRAVVMGDSHGKHVRAAQILDAALERDKDTATATELLEALAYRAELALRAEDPAAARDALARARALALSATERADLAGTLAALEDTETVLRSAQRP
ncbi:VOC family protein [Actinomadura craniellae]|uniref:VOC family protein n=1 Tax=Actinomadura craniellae TaxID=2231787 RepID=A0A365HBH7_9ACTN|nr:VOC family protein [Actinomadura craniellae]RAY16358.1 VOC family protein [Actinomadura craniellae]